MIDIAARTQMSELLRHLASGLITNDEFEDGVPYSKDRAIREIFEYGAWTLYSDLKEYRLVGSDALSEESKSRLARLILFLKSGLPPYEWPDLPPWPWIVERWGWHWPFRRRLVDPRYERWRQSGDHNVWPFFRHSDLEQALKRPVYLNGSHSEPGAAPNAAPPHR